VYQVYLGGDDQAIDWVNSTEMDSPAM